VGIGAVVGGGDGVGWGVGVIVKAGVICTSVTWVGMSASVDVGFKSPVQLEKKRMVEIMKIKYKRHFIFYFTFSWK
jgi:hypothetical protein